MPVIREPFVNYSKIKFHMLQRRPGETGRRGDFADAVAAFDLETSRLPDVDQSFMYIWQFCIDWPDGSDLVIIGRTWREFKHMTAQLGRRLGWNKLLVFVHNLSYEFQFLSGIYQFDNDEVFAMDSRSILTATMYKNFEFRCSYKLFNMSLDMATGKYAPDYHKKSGAAFGYDDLRFSDTPLSRKELLYCVYDVWGLCKAIRGIMALFDDDLYSLPHTSTGYVRREVKREMRPYYHELKDAFPDLELYTALRLAFRGGNTHASRYYAGTILDGVRSVDISSSYPSQQCTKLYPMTPFKRSYDNRESYLDQCHDRGRAYLLHCVLTNVELRDRFIHIPYIAAAKCLQRSGCRIDNGRILTARSLEMYITDIDYRIIRDQYNYELEILDLWVSWYGPLPEPLVDINRRYFLAKTELKGVPGQELLYMKSKNLLNSIYGMTVMDQLRYKILYDDGKYDLDLSVPPQELLRKAMKQPYCLYQWGVWTCAHARQSLQQGIDLCGDGIVYVDTDSCKFIGDPDFSKYNAAARDRARAAGVVATDPKGNRHYMGVYEDDGSYQQFITLGAKKYAYTDNDGRCHITVAGVPKEKGAAELERRGGLKAFAPGFVFFADKLEAVYNDQNLLGVKIDETHTIDLTRNVCLRPTAYTLDVAREYSVLLQDSSKYLRKVIYNCKKQQLQK